MECWNWITNLWGKNRKKKDSRGFFLCLMGIFLTLSLALSGSYWIKAVVKHAIISYSWSLFALKLWSGICWATMACNFFFSFFKIIHNYSSDIIGTNSPVILIIIGTNTEHWQISKYNLIPLLISCLLFIIKFSDVFIFLCWCFVIWFQGQVARQMLVLTKKSSDSQSVTHFVKVSGP